MTKYQILHNIDAAFLRGYLMGDWLVRGYEGEVDAGDDNAALNLVMSKHNRDDRPDGQDAPSLSVGDVIVVGPWMDQYTVLPMGFARVVVNSTVLDGPWRMTTREALVEEHMLRTRGVR